MGRRCNIGDTLCSIITLLELIRDELREVNLKLPGSSLPFPTHAIQMVSQFYQIIDETNELILFDRCHQLIQCPVQPETIICQYGIRENCCDLGQSIIIDLFSPRGLGVSFNQLLGSSSSSTPTLLTYDNIECYRAFACQLLDFYQRNLDFLKQCCCRHRQQHCQRQHQQQRCCRSLTSSTVNNSNNDDGNVINNDHSLTLFDTLQINIELDHRNGLGFPSVATVDNLLLLHRSLWDSPQIEMDQPFATLFTRRDTGETQAIVVVDNDAEEDHHRHYQSFFNLTLNDHPYIFDDGGYNHSHLATLATLRQFITGSPPEPLKQYSHLLTSKLKAAIFLIDVLLYQIKYHHDPEKGGGISSLVRMTSNQLFTFLLDHPTVFKLYDRKMDPIIQFDQIGNTYFYGISEFVPSSGHYVNIGRQYLEVGAAGYSLGCCTRAYHDDINDHGYPTYSNTFDQLRNFYQQFLGC